MKNLHPIVPVLMCLMVVFFFYKSGHRAMNGIQQHGYSHQPLYKPKFDRYALDSLTGSGYIVIFFALPKCGSRTLLTLASATDGHQSGRLSVDSNLTLLPNPMNYDEDYSRTFITEHLKYLDKPSFVYTHARFVDVRGSLEAKSIRYISVIRDPLDRLVSRYYYRRNRDKTEMTEKEREWRASIGEIITNETFDDCVRRNRSECNNHFAFMSTIAHFCGSDTRCNFNVTWAMERAKYNVINYFDVVGIMEEYASVVSVVEKILPSVFHGAGDIYSALQEAPSGVASMKTQRKVPPSDEVRREMTERLRHDYEFYNFVKDRFEEQKRTLGV